MRARIVCCRGMSGLMRTRASLSSPPLCPCAVETSEPDWSPDDGIGAASVPFALNATVFGLTPGKRCVPLRRCVVVRQCIAPLVCSGTQSSATTRLSTSQPRVAFSTRRRGRRCSSSRPLLQRRRSPGSTPPLWCVSMWERYASESIHASLVPTFSHPGVIGTASSIVRALSSPPVRLAARHSLRPLLPPATQSHESSSKKRPRARSLPAPRLRQARPGGSRFRPRPRWFLRRGRPRPPRRARRRVRRRLVFRPPSRHWRRLWASLSSRRALALRSRPFKRPSSASWASTAPRCVPLGGHRADVSASPCPRPSNHPCPPSRPPCR